jgi:hypothetical protein
MTERLCTKISFRRVSTNGVENNEREATLGQRAVIVLPTARQMEGWSAGELTEGEHLARGAAASAGGTGRAKPTLAEAGGGLEKGSVLVPELGQAAAAATVTAPADAEFHARTSPSARCRL